MVNNLFYKQKIQQISLEELCENFELKLIGSNQIVTGINTLAKSSEDELAFLTNKSYLEQLNKTKAKSCLIASDFIEKALEIKKDINYLISDYSYDKLAKITEFFYSEKEYKREISSKASISNKAKLGKNIHIGDFTVINDNVEIGDNTIVESGCNIGSNVKIGSNCKIEANSVIKYSIIGNHVEILSGASIGQDGFGFSHDGKKFKKLLQLGLVIIEDEVSIGANVCIDRGSFSDTIIGFNSKLDNMVQIAHNVQIGKHCLIASQVGISGSTIIGDYVTCGGQVGFAGHLKIGSYNRFAGQSGVTKHIEDNQGDFYGMPAQKKKEWQLQQIKLKKLTKLDNKNG